MRNASRGLLLATVVFGLAHAAHGDESPFCTAQRDLYNTYLSARTSQSVGSAVVTFRLGETPCYFFSGEIEWGTGKTPDANTIFELASVTKIFTTTILALRANEGRLDPYSGVLPDLPSGYSLTMNEQAVTFQQLATFTGGFWWDDPTDFTNGESYSQDDFVYDVKHLDPTDFAKPNGPISGETNLPTINFYSNGSIGFLGQILMSMDSTPGRQYRFTAEGFSNWISDNLTTPLDMPNTSVHPGGGNNKATGYKKKAKNAFVAPFPWEPWGAAGALRSNIADMLTFLEANICAYHTTDPACAGFPSDILSALVTAQTPNNYTPDGNLSDSIIYLNGVCGSPVQQAWAWRYLAPPSPNPDNVTPIISKDGGHPGFSTWIGFDPVKGYGLVILLNTHGLNMINAGQNMIQNTP
jgi:CubicO group peptidase (beta-lactamase class C family)